MGVAPEWGIDRTFRTIRRTPNQGQIAPLERAIGLFGELLRKRAMGLVVFGHDHQASGVLVEAVDDTRSLDAADAGQARAAMGDQRVDQCAGGVAGGRVNDKALRLVDHDDRVVFVNDVERNGLALRRGGFRRG